MKLVNRGRWLGLALTLLTSWCVVAQETPPAAPDTGAAPPPSAPPSRSEAELKKLAEPIALYPDPLISIILPAAAYPVEIVQAARFVRDTNNLPKVDDQPWDQNVKSVAKIPQVIAMMDSNLTWTVDLGEAFIDQSTELMDAIQGLRGLAQNAGTLQTTPQQVVTVTNVVVMQTNVTQIVTVTNKIVEIYPANPQVVYVPTYPPYVYYPPPTYVYNPLAPLVTFGAAVAVGAIIANNCHWGYHGGGIYVGPHGAAVWGGGGYHGNVTVNNFNNVNINNSRNANVNNSRNANINNSGNISGSGNRASQQPAQKWQPDQNRMRTSGAGGASASTREARGWGSGQGGGANAGARPSTGNVGARPSTGMPSTGNAGARPSTGNVGARPSTGNVGARPSTGMPSTGNAGARPSTGNVATRPSTGTAGGSRPSAAPTTSNFQSRSGSSSSAFSGAGSSGSSAKSYSSRGSSSRSSGGYSGGSRGGGGGSRGGGGGGRR
jgi:hypothetical protein